MRPKRLMLLGGIRYLLPVIEAAHQQGYYVITADYLPNNIAHKYSDEYVNVSIINRDAVLKVAREKKIDGIMSFGVDPGVVSASFVQNQLGLPTFGPLESIEILQNKDLFRSFLSSKGFNTPWSRSFKSIEKALKESISWSYPVIVKPTDSAGSKGVSRVDSEYLLKPALENAFKHSISGTVIIEEFIDNKGYSSDSDSMSIDGKLSFTNFNSQHFDLDATNPFVPAAYSWPTSFTQEQEFILRQEIQRLISLLNLKTVVYNIETRIGKDGKPYIMEISPRGGGNRLSEVIRFATGVDMITEITRAMVGDPINSIMQQPIIENWAEIILHSDKTGVFRRIEICNTFPGEVVECDLWVKKGETITSFRGANDAIGTLILKFESSESMYNALANQKDWLKILVD